MDDPLQHETFQALERALEDEEAKVAASHRNLAEQVAKVREALEALSQGIEAEKSRSATSTEATCQSVDALKAFLSARSGGGEALEERVKELEDALKEREQALQTVEERAQQLTEQTAATEEARKRVETLEQQLGEAKAALEQEQTRATGMESQIREQTQEGQGAQEEAVQLRQAREELQTERDTLQGELDGLQAKTEEFESELVALRAELDSLRGQAESAPKPEDLEALREQLEGEKNRADSLDARLKEEMAKGTKSVLAEQLAKALKDAEQAHERLRALERELAQVRQGGGAAKEEAPLPEPEPVEAAVETPMGEAERILAAAKKLGEGKRPALDALLIEAGIVSREQLDEAVEEQRGNPSHHLGQILVDKGYAGEEAVAQALACHSGVRFIRIEEDTVEPDAAALITERLAKQHTCVPIRASEGKLVVAMVNPMNLVAIEDVERATNRKAEVVVSTADDIQQAIERYYWEPE